MRRTRLHYRQISGAKLLIMAAAAIVVLAGLIGSAALGDFAPSLILAVAVLLAFLYCFERFIDLPAQARATTNPAPGERPPGGPGRG